MMEQDRTLPNGWRMVRFDQIAESIVERVDPAEANSDYYVGLEHLDPESLKLRRWGTPDDVIGEKLRFHVGDVIYGRRRAYQRKLAVAEFDGICSAHAMVLRARTEMMLQAFLPFFLQSETFHQRALAISVGSLSPTINWRTLARQEFAIPPLDEQRRIAEILWAADEVIAAAQEIELKSKETLVRACQEWTSGPNQLSSENWKEYKLSECAEILDNRRVPLNSEQRATMRGDIPYYGANGPIDHINDFIFDEEIVLIGEDGDHFFKWQIWQQAYLIQEKSWVNNHAHVFRAKNYCNDQWLYRSFQYRDITSFLQDSASMTRRKLTKATLVSIPICIPSKNDQNRILGILEQLERACQNAQVHVQKCNSLKKELLSNLIP